VKQESTTRGGERSEGQAIYDPLVVLLPLTAEGRSPPRLSEREGPLSPPSPGIVKLENKYARLAHINGSLEE